MKVDPVDPVAEAVVRAQHRLVLVREARRLLHERIAGERADRGATRRGPAGAALDPAAQRGVVAEGVEADRGSRPGW
jgi:hypothetical protein